jgi:hypothetical protein
MKFQSLFCTALALSLMASTALAIDVEGLYWQSNGRSVYWQANGGGCVPTDATIKNQQYWTVTGAGRVKYKGNDIQPLVFSCPVSSINPDVLGGDGTILRLFYQDPDGTGGDFKVEARLKSFNKLNGAYMSEVCIATSGTSGSWRESRVVISRTRPSNLVVEFNGVSLEGAVF